LPWYKEISNYQWKVLVAAGLGYCLEAMDMMLYSMVVIQIMEELRMDYSSAGLVASLSLLSAAFGGILFGILADKMGRTKSLLLSILMYSVFTATCGFSQSVTQLMVSRVLLGFGLGGEWTAGAALITESWPPKHRGKAMGLVQANFAIGYALAAIVALIVLPRLGWRAVFFVGVIPAALTYYIRRNIREPDIWVTQHLQSLKSGKTQSLGEVFRTLFSRKYLSKTVTTSFLCSFCLFAYWGTFTWIPGYLALSPEKGGAGLSVVKSLTWIIIMQAGGMCGHLTFGYISDKIGRKISCSIFFLMSGILTVVYGVVHNATVLLLTGPFLAYFAYGYYAAFGALLAEIFPTSVRATATGLAYNVGRGVSSVAPVVVGSVAVTCGMGAGIALTAVAYIFAIGLILILPETKGKILD